VRRKHKPPDLDPVITEFHNELTGETKWKVFARGQFFQGIKLREPFSKTFATREEAIACYAENFGWVPRGEFQPTEAEITDTPSYES